MRLNRYVALATGLSRRAADSAIEAGRVQVDGVTASVTTVLLEGSTVALDAIIIEPARHRTVMLNKPIGFVTSRVRQGDTETIYADLPKELHSLKPVGRLDKDTSGLLLLSNDGDLAQRLTHPSHEHRKVYEVALTPDLSADDQAQIQTEGVMLSDGVSRFGIERVKGSATIRVTLTEGRNRQIRRTFEELSYHIDRLHRTAMGGLELADLPRGAWRDVTLEELTELAS